MSKKPKKSNLFDAAKEHPPTAARLCQIEVKKLEAGYHEQLYYLLGVAYAIAYEMLKDPKAWLCFRKEAFWKKRKKRPQAKHLPQALNYVLVYVFEAISKQRYDRAWKYATALQLYWNEGLQPDEVPDQIKADGGIEVLVKRAAQIKKLLDREERPIDDDYFKIPGITAGKPSDEEFDEPSGDDHTPGSGVENDEPIQGSEKQEDATQQRKRAKLLQLRASREIRKQVRALAVGETARLTIKRVEGQPAAIIRAVRFKRIAG